MIFEKGNIVFHESLGVCIISDIQKLSIKKEEGIPYYILKKINDKSKVAYVPVENHRTLLRNLILEEEARKIVEYLKENSEKELDQTNDILYSQIEIEEAQYVLKINKMGKKK